MFYAIKAKHKYKLHYMTDHITPEQDSRVFMSIKKYILSPNPDQNNNILLEFINFMAFFSWMLHCNIRWLLLGHGNVNLSANAFWVICDLNILLKNVQLVKPTRYVRLTTSTIALRYNKCLLLNNRLMCEHLSFPLPFNWLEIYRTI